MATVSKILGKSSPNAATNTTLYTVPASTEAVGKLYATNRDSTTAAAIRVAVVLSGGSIATSDYLVYDYSLTAGESIGLSGIALNAGDYVVVRNDNATVSFVLMGIETTD